MIYVTDKKLKGTSFDFYIDLFRSVTVPVLLNFECPSDLDEKIDFLRIVDMKEDQCLCVDVVDVIDYENFDSLRGICFTNYCKDRENTKYFLCSPFNVTCLSLWWFSDDLGKAIKKIKKRKEKYLILK